MEDNGKKRTAAVVLAAGSGRRMESSIKKQYMLIKEKPVIYYALQTFQKSFIDEIVLVVSKGDVPYCQKEIVEKYGFHKVAYVIEGGKERYHSVAQGLRCLKNCDYVYIHDGARPMLTEEILLRLQQCVQETDACVAGMPVKDTIKLVDEDKTVCSTLERKRVWMVQTPQVFAYDLISRAYERLLACEDELLQEGITVTDDAMVVETLTEHPVKLVEGSYENIKITTPEDILTAENFLRSFI